MVVKISDARSDFRNIWKKDGVTSTDAFHETAKLNGGEKLRAVGVTERDDSES